MLQLLDAQPREVAGLQHLSLLVQAVNEWLCIASIHERVVINTLKEIKRIYSLE